MSEHNSSISTREAAEIAGCSTRHIQSMIKNGKLSASRGDSGNYLINKSEFYRVFPDAYNKRTLAKNADENSRIALEKEVQYLKEILIEKNRQNEFLHKQLEVAATEKSMLINTLNSNQKLLEHSSKDKKKKWLGIF